MQAVVSIRATNKMIEDTIRIINNIRKKLESEPTTSAKFKKMTKRVNTLTCEVSEHLFHPIIYI